MGYMNETFFLAQLWGPVLLAVGVGFFTSREFYKKTYRNLEKETLALLVFGILLMVAGVAQIQFHSAWESPLEIVVTLLGWGLLVKGVVFLTVPHIVDRLGDWEADSRCIPFVGTILLLLGGFLCWMVFM